MAMSKARKIVEYFSKSTQQTAKLINFQKLGTLPIYGGPGYRPKKLLQDCITRWWSSYRMLKRLRLCKPALLCLHAAGEIKCEMLDDVQWLVLEQIEITLKKMALWQRILEGDKYPTGSLVVSAIFAIREHYSNVIECPASQEPVKSLTKILLKDFDKRYHPPTGNVGKVKFNRNPEIGERNRYIGVHAYFFIAAFLDLRTKKALKKMMVPVQYQDLRNLVLDLMVELAIEKVSLDNDDRTGDNNDAKEPTANASQLDFAFEGLYDDDDDDSTFQADTYEEGIRIRCEHQLAAYELLQPMKMKDNNGKYNNPLKHWEQNESQSPELCKLAQEFLTIPATSAPSERVWSRAARVIAAKRACLKPEVTSRMMFAQENSQLIREHWNTLMPNVPLSESYLPPPVNDVDEEGNPIDVGQHDDDFD